MDGIKVGELTLEINKLYDRKILELKKEWAFKVQQVYVNLWKSIFDLNHKNAELDFETQLNDLKTNYSKLQDEAKKLLDSAPATYSPYLGRGKNTRWTRKNEDNEDVYQFDFEKVIQKEKSYTSVIKEEFKERLEARQNYNAKNESLLIEELDKQYKIEEEKAIENENNELRTLQNSYDSQDHEIEQHYKKGELTTEQYNKAMARLNEERAVNESAIQLKYISESEAREERHQQEIKKIRVTAFAETIDEYQRYLTQLSKVDLSPVTNSFGFINLKATFKQNNELLNSYKETFEKIQEEKRKLEEKKSTLDPIDYQATKDKMRETEEVIIAGMDNIVRASQEAVDSFVTLLNTYIQQLSQMFTQTLQALWDYQDAAYDHQMEQLEKHIDKYEKLLEKQKDITQKYADEVDDIEDELSSSRGDRRQHLIDQLNAEISAQRASMAEEKKIEKQKKALEAKKEKEEEDQRKREHQRQVTQAFINWHLSVANALATQPFMPVGIAMGALATALGAAQYALVKSQKYADGGVIEGRSHKDGGVKVLGGRAEVEGGEFITNRRSTSANLDLLTYINKKKRRVDLDDMIDFYSSGKIKKNINNISPSRYFADGGYIAPTLSTDIDIDNRILTAIENYSKKPTVVQVVDIVDKMDTLKNVQVLAGLTPNY